MSALDDALTQAEFGSHPDMDIAPAWAELAQLRADLQAAQERVAEQARQLTEACKVLHDYELPEDKLSFALRELACIIPADEMLWHTWLLRQADIIDAWLAANPAPQEPQL